MGRRRCKVELSLLISQAKGQGMVFDQGKSEGFCRIMHVLLFRELCDEIFLGDFMTSSYFLC